MRDKTAAVREIKHKNAQIGTFFLACPARVNVRIEEWQRKDGRSWKRLQRFLSEKLTRFISALFAVIQIYSRRDLDRYVDIIERNLANMEAELEEVLKNPSQDTEDAEQPESADVSELEEVES